MAIEKGLVISSKINESDLARITQALKGLTGELQKMVAVANEASRAFAGILGGVPGGATKAPGQQASSTQKLAGNVTGPGTSAAKSLTQVFSENANAFKNLANLSKDSMRMMAEGLKSSINEQKAALDTLNTKISSTAQALSDLRSGAGANTPAGKAMEATYVERGSKAAVEAANLSGGIKRSQKQLEALSGDSPGEAEEKKGGGGIMGVLGKFGRGGAYAAAAGALLSAAGSIGNQVLGRQMMQSNEEARLSGFAQTAYGVRTGNSQALISSIALGRAALGEQAKGIDGIGGDRTVGAKDLSAGSSEILNFFKMPFGGGKTMGQTTLEKEGDIKLMLWKKAQQDMAAHPEIYAAMGEWMGNQQSNIDQMNRYGIGAGKFFGKDGVIPRNKKGQSQEEVLAEKVAHINALGISPSDYDAGLGALSGYGRDFALRGAGAAGVANAAQMNLGQYAQVAAVSAWSKGGLLSSMMKQGGIMDRNAATTLGSSIAQMAMATGKGGSGGESLFAAASNGMGYDVLDAQRRALGIGEMGKALSPQDTFGQGVGMLASMNTLGNGNLYGSNILAKVIADPAQVADAYNGIVKPEVAAYGIKAQDIVNASESSMATNASARLVDGGGNDPVAKAIRSAKKAIEGGMSVHDWAQNSVKGLRKGTKAYNDARNGGAGVIYALSPGMDPFLAGEVFDTEVGYGSASRKKGKGWGPAATGSTSLENSKRQAEERAKVVLEMLASQEAVVREANKNLKAIGDGMSKFADVGTTAKKAIDGIADLGYAAEAAATMVGKMAGPGYEAIVKARHAAQAAAEQKTAAAAARGPEQAPSQQGRRPGVTQGGYDPSNPSPYEK
jgi:hypothetical protein